MMAGFYLFQLQITHVRRVPLLKASLRSKRFLNWNGMHLNLIRVMLWNFLTEADVLFFEYLPSTGLEFASTVASHRILSRRIGFVTVVG